MIGYSRPLRKINKFILWGNMAISTTLVKNDSLNKRLVIHKKASLPKTSSDPLKIKIKGQNKKQSNVNLTIQHENDILKASLPKPHLEVYAPKTLINMETNI